MTRRSGSQDGMDERDELMQALGTDDLLGQHLRALQADGARPVPGHVTDRHVAAALAARTAHARVAQLRSPVRHAARVAAPSLALAAALVGALFAFGAADALPGRSQSVVARIASFVGIEMPDGNTVRDADRDSGDDGVPPDLDPPHVSSVPGPPTTMRRDPTADPDGSTPVTPVEPDVRPDPAPTTRPEPATPGERQTEPATPTTPNRPPGATAPSTVPGPTLPESAPVDSRARPAS